MAKKKSKLGQVFLIDKNIVKKAVETAEVTEGEWIIEVGPGKGILTEALLNTGANVIAFELDRKLIQKLKKDFYLLIGDRLWIFHEDFLKADIRRLAEDFGVKKFKFVSNIPYYITQPIFDKLIRDKDLYSAIFMTIQREVAQRIIAKPGTSEYGSLTIYMNYHFVPKIEFGISSSCFRPRPKVSSSFISLHPRRNPPVQLKDERLFFRIVRASFSMRRKKLRTVLRSVMRSQFESVRNEAEELIDLDRRGETLSMEEFALLANLFAQHENEPN